MSVVTPSTEIDYPESDGRPMGETDWHISAMIRLRDMLRYRYRGERVYIGSNLLVYYIEGEPRHFIVPDVFVVFDCDPTERRIFKIWDERRVPDIVFEMTSRSTAREDQVFKPKTYEQIGVKELFLFDPTGEYLVPSLQGFSFFEHAQVRLEPREGTFYSEVLGANISKLGNQLVLVDSKTGEEFLTGEESERQAKEVERIGRIAAEAQNERLRSELENLRRQQKDR